VVFAQRMRPNDHFHPEQDRTQLMSAFFPDSPSQLAFDLSNVTSLFYGLLLQVAGERLGEDSVDALSRALFYRLGRLKTSATRAQKSDQYPFTGDVRDLVTVLVSAIYNASPEYQFWVERFDAAECIVHLTGVDRYYRAATALGIEQQLSWPVLHPFFEGIRDELGLQCVVSSALLSVERDARLHAKYRFQAC
jgi:hypothetical protein